MYVYICLHPDDIYMVFYLWWLIYTHITISSRMGASIYRMAEIYIYIYMYIFIYIYMYIYISMYTYMYTYISIYRYLHTYISMNIYIFKDGCIDI
jgi:hypothetical protein